MTGRRTSGAKSSATTSNATTSNAKVSAHRNRLRAQGLRPVQFWVPDTRNGKFVAEAHRQSLNVAASHGEAEDQAFIDSISILDDE
ncbi:antitoxin MazE family protein [Azospirillum agricola]|uniref:antitoxin MazE family protein n=1 Tax=Azospirillum agricola TaxID=1720247 RepID=UPI000A0F3492|nr:antitoxin MazE family protein [Azospirillum agricola]SMH38344.1 Protein of unknown function [Azospirillum lipoferum]